MHNKDLGRMVNEELDRTVVTAVCNTCGQIFLQPMLVKEYEARSMHFQTGSPDKWFIETGIHWCEQPDHQIVFLTGKVPESINAIWEQRRQGEDLTREKMLPYFLKRRAELAGKEL